MATHGTTTPAPSKHVLSRWMYRFGIFFVVLLVLGIIGHLLPSRNTSEAVGPAAGNMPVAQAPASLGGVPNPVPYLTDLAIPGTSVPWSQAKVVEVLPHSTLHTRLDNPAAEGFQVQCRDLKTREWQDYTSHFPAIDACRFKSAGDEKTIQYRFEPAN